MADIVEGPLLIRDLPELDYSFWLGRDNANREASEVFGFDYGNKIVWLGSRESVERVVVNVNGKPVRAKIVGEGRVKSL
jgi:hypothetical protein